MKPVENEQFWKERISEANKRGDIRYSVYLTSDRDWDYLNKVHSDLIKEHLKGKVLDAGCGYGRLSQWVDDYVGVDISPDLLEYARNNYPDKTFLQADLKNLPFKDGEFDWAVCVSIKQMIRGNVGDEAWAEMEKELKRVARNILILEYSNPEQYEIL